MECVPGRCAVACGGDRWSLKGGPYYLVVRLGTGDTARLRGRLTCPLIASSMVLCDFLSFFFF